MLLLWVLGLGDCMWTSTVTNLLDDLEVFGTWMTLCFQAATEPKPRPTHMRECRRLDTGPIKCFYSQSGRKNKQLVSGTTESFAVQLSSRAREASRFQSRLGQALWPVLVPRSCFKFLPTPTSSPSSPSPSPTHQHRHIPPGHRHLTPDPSP